MKKTDIFKGQTYITDMISRFSTSGKENLPPIKVLAHEAGFVIFTRNGVSMAVKTKSFISTYIKACKYRLKNNKDFEYKGYIVVWADGVYNIGNPISCIAGNKSWAKAKIDEFELPPMLRTQCKPTFTLSNGDKIKF